MRSNTFIKSELEEINGIGNITRIKLMKSFGSLEKIKKADKNELIKIIGNNKTEKVFNYFSNTPKD